MKHYFSILISILLLCTCIVSCEKHSGDYGKKGSLVGYWILPEWTSYYYDISADGKVTYYQGDCELKIENDYIVVPKNWNGEPSFYGDYEYKDNKYFYFSGMLMFTIEEWKDANTAVVSSNLLNDGIIKRVKGIKYE